MTRAQQAGLRPSMSARGHPDEHATGEVSKAKRLHTSPGSLPPSEVATNEQSLPIVDFPFTTLR